MSARAADVLELLLPDVGAAQEALARKLVTCLRLLAHAASPRRASSVQLGLESARSELELSTRERLHEALCDLLIHHLGAARGPESFLELGTAEHAHDEAWGRLGEERAPLRGLAHVPAPGESPLEVAARLIACGERLGLDGPTLALWRARLVRLQEGPRAGERAFLEHLAGLGPDPALPARRAALAGAVECLLDRGAVRRAAGLLGEHGALVQGCEWLSRLSGWVHLLLGDEPAARALLTPPAPRPVRIPAQLCALRRERPEWLALLAGATARGRSLRVERVEKRSELGAAVLAVFALGAAGSARVLHADCAPALRGYMAQWTDSRDGACRRPGELEREMVSRAEPIVAHAREGEPLRGALDASIRALAVSPILDRDGELRGWLRLEFEHHLLPSPARLRALARGWRADLAALRAPAQEGPTLELSEQAAQVHPAREGDPRGEVLRGLVEGVGAKTAQRRWWAIAVERGTLRLLAEGGGALEDWRERCGGARALRRALAAAGCVRFEEPDPALSLAADAASGLVVPVAHRGRTLGLLAVESTRRRDVAALETTLERAAAAGALALRVAVFRAWHCERFGHDVLFDVGVAATAALVEDVLAAASATGPVTLCGPAGSGKQVLARWLHLESVREQSSLVVHACGARDAAAEERELFGRGGLPDGLLARPREGTVVLDDPERLVHPAQVRLERWLAEGDARRAGPRIVLTSRSPLEASLRSGRLREDLARRLQRLELFVPALAERREELGGLARQLAARFAAELAVKAPELSDEALALLWRQPWEGNVRELENVVYKLVLCTGERIEPAHVEQVARRFRFELLRRIPPRQADAALLEAALRSTRTQRGTPNKTRAALYLGWDPDTLARHLGEAGLDAGAALA